jgi:hypothetical protein
LNIIGAMHGAGEGNHFKATKSSYFVGV